MKLLKEKRIEYKYSHQKMADILGISKPFYWQLENNKRRLSYDMAVKISEIFDLKPDDLFYQEMLELQRKNKD